MLCKLVLHLVCLSQQLFKCCLFPAFAWYLLINGSHSASFSCFKMFASLCVIYYNTPKRENTIIVYSICSTSNKLLNNSFVLNGQILSSLCCGWEPVTLTLPALVNMQQHVWYRVKMHRVQEWWWKCCCQGGGVSAGAAFAGVY